MNTELYGVNMGMASAVCRRCGALVYLSPEAEKAHTAFHARLDAAEEFAAELQERSE